MGVKPDSSVLWTYMGIELAFPELCVGMRIEPMSIFFLVSMGNELIFQSVDLA